MIDETTQDKSTVGAKARQGLLQLSLRQVAIQIINLASALVLARLLTPEDFGVYAFVAAATVVLSALGDLGLSAALLQKTGSPSRRQLSQVLSLQLLILLPAYALLVVATALTVRLTEWATADHGVMVSVAALAFVWLIYRSSASVQFEGQLNFAWLSRVEIVEVLSFQIGAVACALMGLGPWSFLIALHLRGIAGCALLAWKAPITPRIVFDFADMRELASFGWRYQLGWIGEAMGSLALPLAVAPIGGARGLGLFLNAYNNATRLNVLSELVARVSLPGLSRLREQGQGVGTAVTRGLILSACPGALWCAFLFSGGDLFVEVMFGPRWADSTSIMQVLAPIAITLPIASFCAVVLAADGRAGVRAVFMWIRLVALFPALVVGGEVGGLLGVGIAISVIEGLLAVVSIAALRRVSYRKYVSESVGILVAGAAAFLCGSAIRLAGLTQIPSMFLIAAVVTLVFVTCASVVSSTVRREAAVLSSAARTRLGIG